MVKDISDTDCTEKAFEDYFIIVQCGTHRNCQSVRNLKNHIIKILFFYPIVYIISSSS